MDRATPEYRARQLEYSRKWRRRNPEKARASVERWRAENPEAFAEASRRSDLNKEARFPEKRRARQALKRQIDKGTIARQPCEVCGAEEVHGHHDDYSKPLDVRWLCPVHHRELHDLERTAA